MCGDCGGVESAGQLQATDYSPKSIPFYLLTGKKCFKCCKQRTCHCKHLDYKKLCCMQLLLYAPEQLTCKHMLNYIFACLCIYFARTVYESTHTREDHKDRNKPRASPVYEKVLQEAIFIMTPHTHTWLLHNSKEGLSFWGFGQLRSYKSSCKFNGSAQSFLDVWK